MQRAVLSRATMRVADTTDLSGRVTADEVNLDRFHNGIRKIYTLVAATLILPALAFAQDNHGDNQLAALQAQITALKNRVTALENQLTAAQSVLALAPFVSVDPNSENGVTGPNIRFTGANIHILSGSGATDDNLSNGGSLTGLGNLIIGYDENVKPLALGDRGGSHNLVIGRYNKFTDAAFGGPVAGEVNTVSAEGASVSGGDVNVASGRNCSVTGGNANSATGLEDVVCGGVGNTASGGQSIVLGGTSNAVNAFDSVVIGGGLVTNNTPTSIRPQPPFP